MPVCPQQLVDTRVLHTRLLPGVPKQQEAAFEKGPALETVYEAMDSTRNCNSQIPAAQVARHAQPPHLYPRKGRALRV